MKIGGAKTILRWGLAFVFFFAAVDAMESPATWLHLVPPFIAGSGAHFFLVIFSVYELALAAWLFVGRKLTLSSGFAAATFTAIVVFDYEYFRTIFTLIGLIMAALALFELSQKQGRPIQDTV